MVSPNPKPLDHEKRAWSSIQKIVDDARVIDKQILVDGGAFSFKVMVFSYCINCHITQPLMMIYNAELDGLRKYFGESLTNLNYANALCNKCGGIAIPVGYAYFTRAVTLEDTEKVPIEEIYRKYGSIANHPRKKKVYLTSVVTRIGRNNSTIEEIIEGKDGVKFRKVNFDNMGGRYDLSIYKINLNEQIQKLNHLSPQEKAAVQNILAEIRNKLNDLAI